jgi:hypothetical protein
MILSSPALACRIECLDSNAIPTRPQRCRSGFPLQLTLIRGADEAQCPGPTAREEKAIVKAIFRSVLAVLAGVVVAGVLIVAVEFANSLVFWPAGADPNDPEKLKEVVAGLPLTAFLVVLLGYCVGTFVGGGLAAFLAGRARLLHGVVVGVVFLAVSISNLRSIPHPLWFAVANLALVLPAAYGGARLVGSRGRT